MSMKTPTIKSRKHANGTPTAHQIESENLKQQIKQLHEENSQNIAEINSLKAQLDETKDYIPKNEFDDLFSRWENDKKELQRTQELYRATLDEVDSLRKLTQEQEIALTNSNLIKGEEKTTENISQNFILSATNKALKNQLDAANNENNRLNEELKQMKEDFQREIESISSKIAHPDTDIDEILADLSDEREKYKRLNVENARLKNSLDEKSNISIELTKLRISKASNENSTLEMFKETRREFSEYKKEAETKLAELDLLNSTLSRIYSCPKEQIINCAQKNVYKVKELNRIAIKLAQEEIKSFDYMTRNQKLEKELMDLKTQSPQTGISVELKIKDAAKAMLDRAKAFEATVTQKLVEVQEKSNEASLHAKNVHDSLLASPMLSRTPSSSKSSSLSSPSRRFKSPIRSPLSPRSNAFLSQIRGIDQPSVRRSSQLLQVSSLNPHEYD